MKKDYIIIHEEIKGILENDSYYELFKSRSNWFKLSEYPALSHRDR